MYDIGNKQEETVSQCLEKLIYAYCMNQKDNCSTNTKNILYCFSSADSVRY